MRSGKTCHVICGSSNLTAEGLKSGGEFNLIARLSGTAPAVRRLAAEFDRLWSTETVPLSVSRIEQYARVRVQRPRPRMSARALARVLRGEPSDATRSGDVCSERPRRYWRDSISGFAAQRTEDVLSEETDWDRKRYLWYSSQYNGFQTGDHILLLDQPGRWAEVVVVKETTRTATQTPDGRHFVAYVRARRWRRRRLRKGLWRDLAAVGLAMTPEARTRRRKLTDGQWGRIETVFHK